MLVNRYALPAVYRTMARVWVRMSGLEAEALLTETSTIPPTLHHNQHRR
jgi:hypothetical protein